MGSSLVLITLHPQARDKWNINEKKNDEKKGEVTVFWVAADVITSINQSPRDAPRGLLLPFFREPKLFNNEFSDVVD